MKTTPIYGLPYIEADDLVSSAPTQFKNMAEGFETALNEVDNRNTPAGVKPVIATTLEALAAQTGVTGQTGYVTADTTTANNGPYYYNGTAWLPYATGAMLDSLRNQLTQGYWSTGSSVLRGHGVVYATLWTDAQFQERFGRAWDNEVFVGVTNGDAAAGLSEGLTTRHTENRLDVMSPTAFTGNVRVNWIVAWGKSVS